MTYLLIARSALASREKSEISALRRPLRQCEELAQCEKSEQSEKSPGFEPGQSPLAQDEAERLKARIIAVVTADPAVFDRELYNALIVEWTGYEAALGQQAVQGIIA